MGKEEMSKKKGIFSRLRDAGSILTGRREAVSLEMSVGNASIKTYADAKLEARLMDLHVFLEKYEKHEDYESPEKWIDGLRKKVHEMNRVIKKDVDPFMRGGDRVSSAEILSGWADLYANLLEELRVAEDGYHSKTKEIEEEYTEVQGYEEENDVRDQEKDLDYLDNYYMKKLDQIESFFIKEAKYGFKIMSGSFFEDDVTPKYIMSVQTFGQSPYPTVTPTSLLGRQGDLPRPEPKAYPPNIRKDEKG
jgi:hypothetical protein